jgi:hypothetical protein
MKKWILGIIGTFVATYVVCVLSHFISPPQELFCHWFGQGWCETTFEHSCHGELSVRHPTKDCPFTKFPGRSVIFTLDNANASDGTYTMILLTPEQAKNNANKAVPECAEVPYPWVYCSSGYGQKVISVPFPDNAKDGDYVLRIAYRNKPTAFTARIISK